MTSEALRTVICIFSGAFLFVALPVGVLIAFFQKSDLIRPFVFQKVFTIGLAFFTSVGAWNNRRLPIPVSWWSYGAAVCWLGMLIGSSWMLLTIARRKPDAS